MSNVINFPTPGSREATASAPPHVGAAFLAEPTPHSHAVQFYEDDTFLVETVAQFLRAGLTAGERVLVIASEPHRKAFVAALAEDGIVEAVTSGQLVLLDANETLSRFMIGDMPDGDLFYDVLGRTLAKLRSEEHGQKRVRAYGEMVDLLWRKGNSAAAICLEELWNEAGKKHSFELLCAYVMGNFYKEGDAEKFMEVCRNHTHVMPTERFSRIDDAHARLREISLLQQRAHALQTEVRHRKELEVALRSALKERSRAEEELRACLGREREARSRAESNDQFKEVFLGILGHDLRNPLNTILTTTRLMSIRDELKGDTKKRLHRVITSGVRMQRMIDQLLDFTRARIADGIPVTRSDHNLTAIVHKIVEETRASHPDRQIELRTEGATTACVDPDRIEQVISNLLGNAMAHGDPAQPVTVLVAARGPVASFSVHNFGPGIDPTFLPLLFDPFKRGHHQHGHSAGLGLGLYISDRIVSAHGGNIEVRTSEADGTTFEVILPRQP